MWWKQDHNWPDAEPSKMGVKDNADEDMVKKRKEKILQGNLPGLDDPWPSLAMQQTEYHWDNEVQTVKKLKSESKIQNEKNVSKQNFCAGKVVYKFPGTYRRQTDRSGREGN